MQPIYISDFSELLLHRASLPSPQPQLQISPVVSVSGLLFVTGFYLKFRKDS